MSCRSQLTFFTTVRGFTIAACVGATLVAGTACVAQVRTNVIVHSGDTAPDGNGRFRNFEVPSLNDAGQIAFRAELTNTSGGEDSGIFVGGGASDLMQIVRERDAALDGNGRFLAFEDPSLNEAGQVAFVAELNDAIDISRDFGVFRGSGSSNLLQIARTGDPTPDGNGTFNYFGSFSGGGVDLNEAGETLFIGSISNSSGGAIESTGLFLGATDGGLRQIARGGQSEPGSAAKFSAIRSAVLNNAGQVAFVSQLSESTPEGPVYSSGVFRADDSSSVVAVAREGDAAPDGDGFFTRIGSALLNDSGKVVLYGEITNASGELKRSIYLAEQTGSPSTLVQSGQNAPDGNGVFRNPGFLSLNDAGQVAFRSELALPRFPFIGSGVFRVGSDGSLLEVARENDTVPGGEGIFSNIYNPVINNAGQMAFYSMLRNTNQAGALYIYDDKLGLTEVARIGDPLMGSTVVSLSFAANTGDERSGLNELGQVAYSFRLADNRQGIAIATLVPEPSGLLLGLLASSTVLLGRCRRELAGH